jgi:hypothetical protein
VLTPFGRRGVMVRIMEEGSGGRSGPYYQVSVPGKGVYAIDGDTSDDMAVTHIRIEEDLLRSILNIIEMIESGG